MNVILRKFLEYRNSEETRSESFVSEGIGC